MRAYISASYHTLSDRKFLERFCEAIESLGLKTFLLPRDEEMWFRKRLKGKELIEKTRKEIIKSDVLILEFSHGEVSGGAEIGQAFMLGKPIIIASNRKNISKTMEKIADYIINYSSIEDLKNKLVPLIEEIKNMERNKIKRLGSHL